MVARHLICLKVYDYTVTVDEEVRADHLDLDLCTDLPLRSGLSGPPGSPLRSFFSW